MIQAKHKYQAYAAATQTMARTKQVVMLYDGIIRFVRQAREAIVQKRIEDRYHLLTRASAIVNGLQACLDFENGGQVAGVLYNFYANIGGRIFSIHRTGSLQTCDEVIEDVKKMRDAWHEIDRDMAGSSENEAADSAKPASPVPDDGEDVSLSA